MLERTQRRTYILLLKLSGQVTLHEGRLAHTTITHEHKLWHSGRGVVRRVMSAQHSASGVWRPSCQAGTMLIHAQGGARRAVRLKAGQVCPWCRALSPHTLNVGLAACMLALPVGARARQGLASAAPRTRAEGSRSTFCFWVVHRFCFIVAKRCLLAFRSSRLCFGGLDHLPPLPLTLAVGRA